MNPVVKVPPTLSFLMGVPYMPLSAVKSTLQKAIDELDIIDGDPDLESGDDLEDDFVLSGRATRFIDGAGCSIADPGGCEHDGHEPENWL